MASYTKPSVGYTLFQYKEQLKRSRKQEKHLNQLKRTKITLTDELITKGVRNLKQNSMEDLKAMSREMTYKRKLQMQLGIIRKVEKGVKEGPNYDAIEQLRGQ